MTAITTNNNKLIPVLPEDEEKALSSSPILSQEKVDLTDSKVLLKYLSKQFQSKQYLTAAQDIAKRTYEAGFRMIMADGKYGQAFSMQPEILTFAMQAAENKNVLEIAGASGENGILLAFSGAKKVYHNDITEKEMALFRALKKNLPSPIEKKLEPLDGDCLQILEKHPELEHQMGLILCFNLIHFFNDEKQKMFFVLLKRLLKKNGKVILTVNPMAALFSKQEIVNMNPKATSFVERQCLITDLAKGTLPIARVYHDLSECPEHLIGTNYTQQYLYTKDAATDFKWKVDNQVFNQIDAPTRAKIKKAVEENKKLILSIPKGTVRILTNWKRVYTEQNLSDLCAHHGFQAETAFFTGPDGHIIQNPEHSNASPRHVGIIVSL